MRHTFEDVYDTLRMLENGKVNTTADNIRKAMPGIKQYSVGNHLRTLKLKGRVTSVPGPGRGEPHIYSSVKEPPEKKEIHIWATQPFTCVECKGEFSMEMIGEAITAWFAAEMNMRSERISELTQDHNDQTQEIAKLQAQVDKYQEQLNAIKKESVARTMRF